MMDDHKQGRATLRRLSDAELADNALEATLRATPGVACEARGKALRRAAEASGVDVGKRCSPHHRCGRLSCPVCRRREQLIAIAVYTATFSDDEEDF